MRSFWNMSFPGRLTFGSGAVATLGEVAREDWRRVLVVTDANLVAAGAVSRVTEALRAGGCEAVLFDGVLAEPPVEVALDAAAAAREIQPDAILGLGGGSNLDVAKIAALLAAHPGQPRDYFGFDNVPGPVAPLIGVPTTAGTGSEVSHSAVLTDTEAGVKVSTLSRHLRPRWAIVDPELTFTCPPQATADSGIDALVHAVEAYLAVDFTTLSDGPLAYEGSHPLGSILAEGAIRRIAQHLPTAVAEPTHAAAREEMALAATLAGLAFSNCGVAVVHALEYPIGAAVHCSHGAGNGLLLPYVLDFNRPACVVKLARIAAWLGVDRSDLDDDAAAEAAIDAIRGLRRQVGVPDRLRELGVVREQLPEFAAKSIQIERLMTINPRRPTEGDLRRILEAAF